MITIGPRASAAPRAAALAAPAGLPVGTLSDVLGRSLVRPPDCSGSEPDRTEPN
ncbi:hypothetical protein [Variovorax defluvii]|uniref:hypothetical protein n=1 Tax=Variovorax defluvii TaxID=913761 RepID=UPI0031F1B8F5